MTSQVPGRRGGITRRRLLQAGAAALAGACVRPARAEDEPAEAEPIQVRVDWDDVRASTTPLSFGLNGYSAVAPVVAAQPTYGRNLSYMQAGFLRYHYAGLAGRAGKDSRNDPRAWVRNDARGWDAARIDAAMAAAGGWATAHGYTPEKLITIPNWPAWMRTDSATVPTGAGGQVTINGLLHRDEYDNFAAFCADLVRILNVEQGRGITYFEVTNERDNLYYVPFLKAGAPHLHRLDALVDIYNRAAVAMKAVDPTIRVGGPAFTRADLVEQVRHFVRGAQDNLDFLSYHFYASGNAADSDAAIYDRTAALGRHTRDIVAILAEESPGRAIPAFLNEYNISYDYRKPDPRMKNHKGATFDALAMIAAVENGAAGTNAWNERDGVYGKLDGGSNLRIGAETFRLFNTYLVGDRVAAASSAPGAIVAFAVRGRPAGRYAYLIVNRSPDRQRVKTHFGGWMPGAKDLPFTQHQISAAGYGTATVSRHDLTDRKFHVPGDSVTLLTYAAA